MEVFDELDKIECQVNEAQSEKTLKFLDKLAQKEVQKTQYGFVKPEIKTKAKKKYLKIKKTIIKRKKQIKDISAN